MNDLFSYKNVGFGWHFKPLSERKACVPEEKLENRDVVRKKITSSALLSKCKSVT